jgi:putative transposase
LLVDARGVPLSIIVTGANVHDVSEIGHVLAERKIKRQLPKHRRTAHLCLDMGYRGATALKMIVEHGYIPHVASRKQEANVKRCNAKKKARRWVVEVGHSWFNRFRKLLVRYEKLHRSFMALNHLAAAIIAFRKCSLKVNIIYG